VNAAEMGKLLGFAASYDNRTVGEAEVIAWLQAIGDLPFDDARAAIAAHYGSESTERLMPGHIRRGVKAMRRDRIDRCPVGAPAPELTDQPVRYRETLVAAISSIADGKQVRRAISPAGPSGPSGPTGLPADQIAALKARLAQAAHVKPKLSPQEFAAQQAEESRRERESQNPEGTPE
jgi:hypothetical protein